MDSEIRMYSGNYREIFSRCLEVIDKCRWHVASYDENKGIIIARTGTSILSWGEEVTIRIFQEGNGIMIEVISEPIAQFIDWGKSEENIRIFYNWFEIKTS